jgi:hypothetical protein
MEIENQFTETAYTLLHVLNSHANLLTIRDKQAEILAHLKGTSINEEKQAIEALYKVYSDKLTEPVLQAISSRSYDPSK